VVEGLARFPGLAGLRGGALQVAPRHVQPDGVAEDVAVRLACLDIAPALADAHDEFDFVVAVGGLRGIRKYAGFTRGYLEQRVRGLGEEDRRRAFGVVPHLAHMGLVVAADAEHAAHREAARTAGHGERNRRRRREEEVVRVGQRLTPR
jgi:hypothetical protein